MGLEFKKYLITANRFIHEFCDRYKHIEEIEQIIKIFRSVKYDFSDSTKTACISIKGKGIKINISPEFFRDYIKTPEDIGFVICHEVLHYIMGHFQIDGLAVIQKAGHDNANIAMDIVINHILYQIIKNPEQLFVHEFYKKTACPGELLKPVKSINTKKLHKKECKEIFGLLSRRELGLNQAVKHVVFHNGCRHIEFAELIVNNGVLSDILDNLKKILEVLYGKFWSGREFTEERRVEKSPASLKGEIVQKIIEMIWDDSGGSMSVPFHGEGVLPFYSRSDFVFIPGNVFVPIFHGNTVSQEDEIGVRIYIDVSGSIHYHIPFLLSVIENLGELVAYPIFGLSTFVYPITRQQLLDRTYRTTGGTDFDAFAKHVMENKYKKVVFITDGLGWMSEENASFLKQNVDILTLLTEQNDMSSVKLFSRECMVIDIS